MTPSKPSDVIAVDPLEGPLRELFAALQHADEAEAVDGAADSSKHPGQRLICGEAGREQLGVRVRWRLLLLDGQLLQARYRAYGCPHTLATCEWVARELETASRSAPSLEVCVAAIGAPADWLRHLQIPAAKLGRLLVVEDALRAALDSR